VTSFQIQVWQDLFSSPLFEFHGKRHFMEFYLNFKMPFLKDVFLGSKLDVPMEDHDDGQAQEFPKSKEIPRGSQSHEKLTRRLSELLSPFIQHKQ